MKHLIVETREGPIYFAGRMHADPTRPALVVMGGIWAPPDLFHEVIAWFPGATVLIAPLPGMGESKTPRFEVALMTRMLDQAIEYLLPDVPVVAFGASTGSLVTLGLRSPQIVRQVALEPFFRTKPLWPLLDFTRASLASEPENAGAATAAEGLFGFTPQAVEDRDYRGLLEGLCTPTDVIVGTEPLEPVREVASWPSFTSAEDRASLAAHPLVTLHDGPPGSGHALSSSAQGAALIRKILHQALRSLAASPPKAGA